MTDDPHIERAERPAPRPGDLRAAYETLVHEAATPSLPSAFILTGEDPRLRTACDLCHRPMQSPRWCRAPTLPLDTYPRPADGHPSRHDDVEGFLATLGQFCSHGCLEANTAAGEAVRTRWLGAR